MCQKRTIRKEETESRFDSLEGRGTRAETQLTCQRRREKAMFQERNRGRDRERGSVSFVRQNSPTLQALSYASGEN